MGGKYPRNDGKQSQSAALKNPEKRRSGREESRDADILWTLRAASAAHSIPSDFGKRQFFLVILLYTPGNNPGKNWVKSEHSAKIMKPTRFFTGFYLTKSKKGINYLSYGKRKVETFLIVEFSRLLPLQGGLSSG